MAEQRPVVFDQAFERFPAQIEAIESGVAALKIRHNTQGLRIVIEAPVTGEAFVERPFASMSERRMAEVMSERQRLGEVFIQAQGARERPGDLHNFERMRKSRTVVVTFVIDEHLRFMGQPPERSRVDNPVAIAAERIAGRTHRFCKASATALRRIGSKNCPLAPCFDRHCRIDLTGSRT